MRKSIFSALAAILLIILLSGCLLKGNEPAPVASNATISVPQNNASITGNAANITTEPTTNTSSSNISANQTTIPVKLEPKKTLYSVRLVDVLFVQSRDFFATFEEKDVMDTITTVQIQDGESKKLPFASDYLTVTDIGVGAFGRGIWAKVVLPNESAVRTVSLGEEFNVRRSRVRLVDVAYPDYASEASFTVEPYLSSKIYAADKLSVGDKVNVSLPQGGDLLLKVEEINFGYLGNSNWVRFSGTKCAECRTVVNLGERKDVSTDLQVGSPLMVALTNLSETGYDVNDLAPAGVILQVLDSEGRVVSTDSLDSERAYSLPDGFIFRLGNVTRIGAGLYTADFDYYGTSRKVDIGERFFFE